MSGRWRRAPHREGAGAAPQPPSERTRVATMSPRSRSAEIPTDGSRARPLASRRRRALARRSRRAARNDPPRHARPRSGASLRRSERMMARRKQHGLPAQDDGGGEIGHRRVANIDEAQIVVAVPCPEDERRHINGHARASGYILIADQEN